MTRSASQFDGDYVTDQRLATIANRHNIAFFDVVQIDVPGNTIYVSDREFTDNLGNNYRADMLSISEMTRGIDLRDDEVTVVLANAERSYSNLNYSSRFENARLTVTRIFPYPQTADDPPDSRYGGMIKLKLFIGYCSRPEWDEEKFTIKASFGFSTTKLDCPRRRVTSQCPWRYASPNDGNGLVFDGYECPYFPASGIGVVNPSTGQPFPTCGYSISACRARGMAGNGPDGRDYFGGHLDVPFFIKTLYSTSKFLNFGAKYFSSVSFGSNTLENTEIPIIYGHAIQYEPLLVRFRIEDAGRFVLSHWVVGEGCLGWKGAGQNHYTSELGTLNPNAAFGQILVNGRPQNPPYTPMTGIGWRGQNAMPVGSSYFDDSSFGGINLSGTSNIQIRIDTRDSPFKPNDTSINLKCQVEVKYGNLVKVPTNRGGTTYYNQTTDKPVWVVRDLLTNKRYGGGITDSYIDDSSSWDFAVDPIGRIYRRTFNGIIQNKRPIQDLISDILITSQLYLIQSVGKYKFGSFIKYDPAAVITYPLFFDQDIPPNYARGPNILRDFETGKSSLKVWTKNAFIPGSEIPNTIYITFHELYQDSTTGQWTSTERTIVVRSEVEQRRAGTVTGTDGFREFKKDFTAVGCTNRQMAALVGLYILRTGEFCKGGISNNQFCEFQTGLKDGGLFLEPGDRFKVYSRALPTGPADDISSAVQFIALKIKEDSNGRYTITASRFYDVYFSEDLQDISDLTDRFGELGLGVLPLDVRPKTIVERLTQDSLGNKITELNLSWAYPNSCLSAAKRQPVPIGIQILWRRSTWVSGTVLDATSTSLLVADQGYNDNMLAGAEVMITSGPGSGQMRTVTGNTTGLLTVSQAWTVLPVSGSSGFLLRFPGGLRSLGSGPMVISPGTSADLLLPFVGSNSIDILYAPRSPFGEGVMPTIIGTDRRDGAADSTCLIVPPLYTLDFSSMMTDITDIVTGPDITISRITVSDASGFPDGTVSYPRQVDNLVVALNEVMMVLSRSGNTLTVLRGQEGTGVTTGNPPGIIPAHPFINSTLYRGFPNVAYNSTNLIGIPLVTSCPQKVRVFECRTNSQLVTESSISPSDRIDIRPGQILISWLPPLASDGTRDTSVQGFYVEVFNLSDSAGIPGDLIRTILFSDGRSSRLGTINGRNGSKLQDADTPSYDMKTLNLVGSTGIRRVLAVSYPGMAYTLCNPALVWRQINRIIDPGAGLPANSLEIQWSWSPLTYDKNPINYALAQLSSEYSACNSSFIPANTTGDRYEISVAAYNPTTFIRVTPYNACGFGGRATSLAIAYTATVGATDIGIGSSRTSQSNVPGDYDCPPKPTGLIITSSIGQGNNINDQMNIGKSKGNLLSNEFLVDVGLPVGRVLSIKAIYLEWIAVPNGTNKAQAKAAFPKFVKLGSYFDSIISTPFSGGADGGICSIAAPNLLMDSSKSWSGNQVEILEQRGLYSANSRIVFIKNLPALVSNCSPVTGRIVQTVLNGWTLAVDRPWMPNLDAAYFPFEYGLYVGTWDQISLPGVGSIRLGGDFLRYPIRTDQIDRYNNVSVRFTVPNILQTKDIHVRVSLINEYGTGSWQLEKLPDGTLIRDATLDQIVQNLGLMYSYIGPISGG